MDVATWGIDVVVVWVLRIRFNDSAADEYNLNVVDCNASVTVARRSSISVSGGLGGTVTPSRRRQT